jgi:hypothetical protein
MRLEARECGHVPPTRQQREFKETVLNGVQDRCLVYGHGDFSAMEVLRRQVSYGFSLRMYVAQLV